MREKFHKYFWIITSSKDSTTEILVGFEKEPLLGLKLLSFRTIIGKNFISISG
jgi:hypothetical protein